MPRVEEFADLRNMRFGKLTALWRVPETRPARWQCRCDCGEQHTALAKNLRAGLTRSCGCIRKPRAA